MDSEATNGIRLVFYRRKAVYDDFQVSQNSVEKWEKRKEVKVEGRLVPVKLNRRGCNAYLAKLIVDALLSSKEFRGVIARALWRICKNTHSDDRAVVMVKLLTPKKQVLDYRWSEMIEGKLIERQNIEYSMSWLSTLGGAFSAMGETFQHCAEMAGKISVKQFKLALQLDDPSVVARCKLWAALSLIQRNELNYPRVIIEDVFSFAKKIDDIRLQRMCKGIWEKLRYHRFLRKEKQRRRKKM